jgi:hypothetical protein
MLSVVLRDLFVISVIHHEKLKNKRDTKRDEAGISVQGM